MEEQLQINENKQVESPIRNNRKRKKRREASTTSVVGFSVAGLLCLLVYSYIELLGWMYLTMGNVKFSILVTGILAILLAVTSFILPRIWSSNSAFVSKRRTLLMIVFSILFLIFAGISFIGESHFAKINKIKEQIEDKYTSGIAEARELYPTYQKYVDNRLKNYENILRQTISNKNVDFQSYQKFVGMFPGINDQVRINNLKKSLHRTLQPTNDQLQENFVAWLDNAGEANIWNISFVSNITLLDKKISTCIDNLNKLSGRFIHPGEKASAFEYPQYVSNADLQIMLSEPSFYLSWRLLAVFLVTIFTLIMPTLRDGLRSRKDL
jgi:hypothetical protein